MWIFFNTKAKNGKNMDSICIFNKKREEIYEKRKTMDNNIIFCKNVISYVYYITKKSEENYEHCIQHASKKMKKSKKNINDYTFMKNYKENNWYNFKHILTFNDYI